MITDRLPHVFYGGDYNPDQWPEEVWEEDARLMQEAGVNLVSLAIFSWARLEPRPGEYDFDWLDRVVDLLDAHGVKVDLATATASPPPWLAKLHPESLPVTREGVRLWPGSRQHYCPSSSEYRKAAASLVRRLAERYRDHPALVMWHVNNEYGCHVPECYCDTSARHFREWLRARYGSLEALNDAWGTAFWAQHYSDWDEVNPPRATPTFPNPTQQLDFRRFSSDALLECFEMEARILREITPGVPVSTNFMGFFKPLDYWKWAEREDVVADDSYPDPSDPEAHVGAAMSYDLMRSLGGGRPWVLMEQTPSKVNWRRRNALKRPGQMRLWSYQAVARGADGVMFFQWRASRAGAEKFHGAMVPHVGTESSRTWEEVRQLGSELGRLDALLGARTPASVAIVFDWESWWGLELDSRPSADVRMLEQAMAYYRPLFEANIAVDFVRPDADLSGYRIALVPNLYMTPDDAGERLGGFVSDGGALVMSFFSGTVDRNDHVRLGGYPAQLRELLGLRVEDFDAYAPEQRNHINVPGRGAFECDLWSDLIGLEGAEPLATYTADFYAGRSAVTRNRFGRGVAYYLGTRPEPGFMDWLLGTVCSEAGVEPALEAPDGVEATIRTNGGREYLFVLNHGREGADVRLPGGWRDLLTGEGREGTLRLDPFGVAVLERA